MNEGRKEIQTERFSVGKRAYFLDVKESKDGIKYLVISESDLSDPTHPHNRVMIFDEAIDAFNESLAKVMIVLRPKKQPIQVQEIRKQHPRAYEKWTKEDDKDLEDLFHKKTDMKTIAKHFERQESAIKSRLVKLGLLKPN